MTDYEEQVLITGVKSGQQCPICTVPPLDRGSLWDWELDNIPKWAARTHSTTMGQINKQKLQGRGNKILKSDPQWIHEVPNFAWEFPHVDIHAIMMVDLLHQLHKGIMQHTLQWLESLGADLYPSGGKKNRDKNGKKIATNWKHNLDERFRQAPRGTGLQVFKHFSEVKQWTGQESKQIVRQVVPVLAPLLEKLAPAAILFVRALVEFIMLAEYRTHTAETLSYMEDCLRRMDLLKEQFRDIRKRKNSSEKDEGDFNLPKWHALTHYPDFIRQYGGCDGMDSSHMELQHKTKVKAFYGRTNKHKNWKEEGLTRHVNIDLNLAAMEGRLNAAGKLSVRGGKKHQVPVATTASRPRSLVLFRGPEWEIGQSEMARLKKHGLSSDRFRSVGEWEKITGCEGLVEAAATFISYNRQLRRQELVKRRD